jgi:hypothetical protein
MRDEEEFQRRIQEINDQLDAERQQKSMKIGEAEAQAIGIDLNQLLKKIWNEVVDPDVIYLSDYKYERSRRYPGVGFRYFTDFYDHKKWLEKERNRLLREENNRRISKKYLPKENDDV